MEQSETSPMTENKIAIFSIPEIYMRNPKHWGTIKFVLSHIVVVEANMSFAYREVHFIGYSEKFLPVLQGESPPEYLLWILEDEDGILEILEFRERNSTLTAVSFSLPGEENEEIILKDARGNVVPVRGIFQS